MKTTKRGRKVQQIEKIENYLREYKNYKIGMITLQKQLDYIMPDITATYELREGSSGTFNIKSDTEAYAIDRLESKRALVIHEDLEKYRLIVESIEEALTGLNENEQKYVKMRYFEDQSVQKTSMEMGYSDKHLSNLRLKIMEKLLISLKGLLQL